MSVLNRPEPEISSRLAGKQDSFLRITLRRFVRNRAAVVGMIIVTIFLVAAVFASPIAPYDPSIIDLANRLQAPSAPHWLGTDELGRDVFSRIIFGARITLLITASAVGLALFVGTALGMAAGFYRGVVDAIISRFIDVLMSMPGFLLAIAIIAVLGSGTSNVIIAVGVYSIPSFARVARGSTLSVREQDYVLAARATGASNRRIMLHHVMPNIIPPLIIQATLRLATAILSASSLSFLGLGPQPPTPEWGAMLSAARDFFTSSPQLIVFPGLAILLVTLSFNLIGDGLRDALDPRAMR